MHCLASTTGSWVIQLDLVARHLSDVGLRRDSIEFECTSSTLSQAPTLYTGNLPPRFPNAKSHTLTDNRNSLLGGVLSGLFCRVEKFAVANMRRYVRHAMEGTRKMCAGMSIHGRRRGTIPALSVPSYRSLVSSGMTRPGSMLFVPRRWSKHEPHDAHPSRMVRCLYTDGRAARHPVLAILLIGIESPWMYFIVTENESKSDV